MAERVRDASQLPALIARGAGVVRVGRDIRDIRARAIFGQHPAVAVVGVGPGARDVGRTRVSVTVRVSTLPRRVVREGGRAIRFGDRGRHSIVACQAVVILRCVVPAVGV